MSLTCRNIRQLHDAFVDGELSPSLTAEVHAHLLQCPACQRQIEMLRAVGHVVRDDHDAPMLDSGFAQRVVESIPKTVATADMPLPRRRLLWRFLSRASIPAVAAAMFLLIIAWPGAEPPKQPRVLGVVKSVVDPALDAVADTKRAAQDLNQLFEISMGQAREDVKQGLDKVEAHRQKSSRPVSITDVLLRPFDEILISPPAQAETTSGGSETVRF